MYKVSPMSWINATNPNPPWYYVLLISAHVLALSWPSILCMFYNKNQVCCGFFISINIKKVKNNICGMHRHNQWSSLQRKVLVFFNGINLTIPTIYSSSSSSKNLNKANQGQESERPQKQWVNLNSTFHVFLQLFQVYRHLCTACGWPPLPLNIAFQRGWGLSLHIMLNAACLNFCLLLVLY